MLYSPYPGCTCWQRSSLRPWSKMLTMQRNGHFPSRAYKHGKACLDVAWGPTTSKCFKCSRRSQIKPSKEEYHPHDAFHLNEPGRCRKKVHGQIPISKSTKSLEIMQDMKPRDGSLQLVKCGMQENLHDSMRIYQKNNFPPEPHAPRQIQNGVCHPDVSR